MSDHTLIYIIVIFNSAVQVILIRRLKLSTGEKYLYCALAAGIPLLLTLTMRFLIAGSLFHGRLVDQTQLERYITTMASSLLIIGPWIVTVSALIARWRDRYAHRVVLSP